jgi:hypothetical protein
MHAPDAKSRLFILPSAQAIEKSWLPTINYGL